MNERRLELLTEIETHDNAGLLTIAAVVLTDGTVLNLTEPEHVENELQRIRTTTRPEE